ncbi:IS66 family transposase, partial [Nannocystis pusilla]|uniref:IS66 family transposase n=1 Tax=Nannocystis pusilla TaxID=889268 RepID=UPI003BF0BBE6
RSEDSRSPADPFGCPDSDPLGRPRQRSDWPSRPRSITAFPDTRALDGTPLAKALGYARNQRSALQRFLSDGRLPLENNISERNLRREVIGRKNWLFLGSEEGAR